MSGYELRQFSLPVDVEEVFTAELWSLGALGFEVHGAEPGRLRLDAYFPTPLPAAARRRRLAAWQGRGVSLLASRILDDRDWLASYRSAAEPFNVGRRLRIVPGDPSADPPADPPARRAATGGSRFTLKIPAQTAFGTGSHESTRLVLEWLEELDLTGLAVLDVGTGSGILSFAAELLGAGRIVACDIDSQSVCIASGNARLNGAGPKFFAGGIGALRHRRRFDLALVNILPENFADEIPSLARILKLGGRVISSGNLFERRGELITRWRRRGFVPEAERRQGDWLAFMLVMDGNRRLTS